MHLCRSWKCESSCESAWGQPGQRKVQRDVTWKKERRSIWNAACVECQPLCVGSGTVLPHNLWQTRHHRQRLVLRGWTFDQIQGLASQMGFYIICNKIKWDLLFNKWLYATIKEQCCSRIPTHFSRLLLRTCPGMVELIWRTRISSILISSLQRCLLVTSHMTIIGKALYLLSDHIVPWARWGHNCPHFSLIPQYWTHLQNSCSHWSLKHETWDYRAQDFKKRLSYPTSIPKRWV